MHVRNILQVTKTKSVFIPRMSGNFVSMRQTSAHIKLSLNHSPAIESSGLLKIILRVILRVILRAKFIISTAETLLHAVVMHAPAACLSELMVVFVMLLNIVHIKQFTLNLTLELPLNPCDLIKSYK